MAQDRGFVTLAPRDRSQAGNVGCLLILAAFLLVIGCGILGILAFAPGGAGDAWVALLVGGGFALVGGVLLWGGIRGARGLGLPPAEVALEGGAALVPGAAVGLRLRQPGPIAIESLKLRVSCDRVYQRQVRPGSAATVEDHETLWEATPIAATNERVPAGGALVREGTLAIPPDARPSGAAQPDGRIRWQAEVFVEAGPLRATYRVFDLAVRARARDDAEPGEATAAERPPQASPR